MEQKNEKKREEKREVKREGERKSSSKKGYKRQPATWDMLPPDSVVFLNLENVSYFITPQGEVFSYHRSTDMLYKRRLHKEYTKCLTLTRRFKTKCFYLSIPIHCSKCKSLYLSVHRLVAKYYCKNDDPAHKTQVDHIDGNRENNDYRNLEWVTPEENLRRRREMRGWKKSSESHLQAMKRFSVKALAAHWERKRRLQEVNLFN